MTISFFSVSSQEHGSRVELAPLLLLLTPGMRLGALFVRSDKTMVSFVSKTKERRMYGRAADGIVVGA